MTAPLTPREADLQDFPFMPLHVARLRDSDLAAEEAPEACWYAVLLWSAAWHQLPAGSLPDNDTVLCKLLGLGRDIKSFRKHRAGALRGWVVCDDGRLYHPVVAEQVAAAWDSKLRQRHRTFCAAVRKHNQRNPSNEIETPSFDLWLSTDCPSTPSLLVTSVSRVTPPEIECDIASKGQGQGQGQGEKKEERTAAPSLTVVGRAQKYEFEGRTIKLTAADFAAWRSAYGAVPDIVAELTALDAWFQTKPDKRDRWFQITSGALNRKHQEMLANRESQFPAGHSGIPI